MTQTTLQADAPEREIRNAIVASPEYQAFAKDVNPERETLGEFMVRLAKKGVHPVDLSRIGDMVDEIERLNKIYISAVNGRKDFREAFRKGRDK